MVTLFLVTFLYTYFIWQSQAFLDTLDAQVRESRGLAAKEEPQNPVETTEVAPKKPEPKNETLPDKYIVFMELGEGQGHGNVISGLLAAHLFGEEYDRIVCVSPLYKTFHEAFEVVDPIVADKCAALFEAHPVNKRPLIPLEAYVRIINFEKDPDECWLQEVMEADTEILYMESNTYPRWPKIPDNFFFEHYKARPELLEILPYKEPPHTVVHLRAPDSAGDHRAGLDDLTLVELGNTLPHDSYLVTNSVEWYDRFAKDYGWSHPTWEDVVHSALRISWKEGKRVDKRKVDKHQQNLQMMADWLTMLTAKEVYHTKSDFSLSAIHWMNIPSKTIMGFKDGALILQDEYWRTGDGEAPRMVDRRRAVEAEPTFENLQLCGVGPRTLPKYKGVRIEDPESEDDEDTPERNRRSNLRATTVRQVP